MFVMLSGACWVLDLLLSFLYPLSVGAAAAKARDGTSAHEKGQITLFGTLVFILTLGSPNEWLNVVFLGPALWEQLLISFVFAAGLSCLRFWCLPSEQVLCITGL